MGISRRIFSQAVQSGTAEISDKLVEFGSTTSGTPSDDVGIIVNRGTSTNAFLGWDESEDKFVAATTSATGASTGDLTLTPTALKCGDLTVDAGDVVYGNGQDATMSVTATAHNAAGKPLTITAGLPTAGTTNNIAGGTLTLQGGKGKGSGAGGDIILQVANAGGSGSALNSHATALTISDDTSATFAANVTVGGDIILDDGGSLKEAGGTAAITFDGSGNVTKIGQDSPSSSDVLQWDGAKWIAAAVSGGSVSAVANGVDNRIATFSSSTALNGEANLTFDGSTLAVTGAMSTTTTATVGTDLTVSGGDIAFGNGQNATVSLAATAHNAAGKSLTVSAGPTTAGTTNDIAGGDLVFAGGQGKGTGAGGQIKFQIAESAAGSASSLNALVDTMILDDPGMLTIKRDMDSDYTALKLYNQSDSNNTNGKVSMQFSLEDTGGTEVDAGKIICEKEAAFTATAGTQDAKFQWQLSLNGTITNAMELSSGGDLTAAGDITAGGNIYGAQFLYHSGDTDTSLKFTADQINLTAGNINMLKIKETTQDEVVWFEDGNDVDFRIECPGKAYFFWIDSGNDRLQIGGNAANCLTAQMFNIQDGNIALANNVAGNTGSELHFAKSRHATDGSHTVVADDDILGEIVFMGSDGTDLEQAASIKVNVDGTPGNDDMPGKLVFSTTQDGAKTLTEAVVIRRDQSMECARAVVVKGALDGLGATVGAGSHMAMDYTSGGGRMICRGDASTLGTFTVRQTASDSDPAQTSFLINTSGNIVGSSTYHTYSDIRRKENIRTLSSVLTQVGLLRPVLFSWKEQWANTARSNDIYGFIAQEVKEIFPDAILEMDLDETIDGDEMHLSYTELVPILTKAIQEQQALIQALTARVTALEG